MNAHVLWTWTLFGSIVYINSEQTLSVRADESILDFAGPAASVATTPVGWGTKAVTDNMYTHVAVLQQNGIYGH